MCVFRRIGVGSEHFVTLKAGASICLSRFDTVARRRTRELGRKKMGRDTLVSQPIGEQAARLGLRDEVRYQLRGIAQRARRKMGIALGRYAGV